MSGPSKALEPSIAQPNDDEVEASRAPLLDHLVELRKRLLVCVVTVVLGFVGCFFFADHIYRFLVRPFYDAGDRSGTIDMEDLRLVFTGLEYFFSKLRLALFGGIVLSVPILAFQVYAFVAPGLYKNERAAFLPFLMVSPVLFIAGASLVYYFILPQVLGFALNQQYPGGEGEVSIELLQSVSDYLNLVTTLILAFGFAFQLPVILTLLARVGLITSQTLIKSWKYALVGIFVVAAFLTPPDPISQIGLGLCVFALYWLSVLSVWFMEKRHDEAWSGEGTPPDGSKPAKPDSEPSS